MQRSCFTGMHDVTNWYEKMASTKGLAFVLLLFKQYVSSPDKYYMVHI